MTNGLLHGLDVSHWDGNFSWSAAKAAGVSFAFIKATEGIASVDRMFQENWLASEKHGILRGAYHFYRPAADPYSQANLFLKTVESELGYPPDLPCVLDLEVGQENANNVIDGALRWLSVVQKAMRKTPIIYLSPSFMNDLGNPSMFGSYILWLAEYGVEIPRVPKPWTNWKFWQYTESGTLPGSTEKLDLNYFQGSYEELKAIGTAAT